MNGCTSGIRHCHSIGDILLDTMLEEEEIENIARVDLITEM